MPKVLPGKETVKFLAIFDHLSAVGPTQSSPVQASPTKSTHSPPPMNRTFTSSKPFSLFSSSRALQRLPSPPQEERARERRPLHSPFVVALALFTPVVLSANDWPQWRGPHRDGVSEEKGLLQEWPKEGPNLVWQVKDIGAGFST